VISKTIGRLLGDRGSILGRGIILSPVPLGTGFVVHPSLLPFLGVNQPEREINQSSLYTAEIWSFK
jgi:hypothetical protein